MSPHVVAFVSQKGGTGKTTTAINLAVAAFLDGKRAVICDLDPMASATAFASRRADKTLLVQPTHPAALPALLRIAEVQGVDFVLIDTAAGTDTTAAKAVEASSLSLIPCSPSLLDLEGAANSIRLCRLQGRTPHVVLTKIEAQGTMAGDARAQFHALGVDVLAGGLGNRAAYRHSMLVGQGVIEYEPLGKAAIETRALYELICKLVTVPSRHLDNEAIV